MSIRNTAIDHKAATLLVISFIILGTLYGIITPIFEASDEIFHYPVVQHIATTRRLPVQVVGQEAAWHQEGSQPPLYYMLSAALTFWANTDDLDTLLWNNPHAKLGVPGDADNKNMIIHTDAEQWPWHGTVLAVHIIRQASVLMAAASVAFGYALALEIAPADGADSRRLMALLAAALMAFNPMFLFISASVNNDNLLILLSTIALYLLARVLNDGLTVRRTLCLALAVALATLTKWSGLTLLPVVGLVLLIDIRRSGQSRPAITAGLFIVGATLIIAGWWYARNLRLYGELLGLQTMVAIAGPRLEPVTLLELSREWRGFWLSYWALFGAVNILADDVVYIFYNVISWLGLIGLGVWLWRIIRTREWQSALLPALMALQILLVFVGLVRWTMMTLASQGRLMFPVLAAISALLALGWLTILEWLSQTRRRLAFGGVGLLMAAIALIAPWRYIATTYAAPPQVTQPPSTSTAINVFYGDALQLVAIESHDAIVQPGGYLPITLYWRAAAPIERDFSIFVHALGREATEVGKVDAYPGAGRLPTTRMPPDTIFEDEYLVPLDDTLSVPTAARVLVGVWDFSTGEVLPLLGPDGQPLENVIVDAGSIVPPEPVTLQAPVEQHADVGGFAQLIGYQLSASRAASAAPGASLDVDLYWRGLGATPTNLTVFVHLIDQSGTVLTQADAPPLAGDYPTGVWQPAVDVIDTHTLTLPADLTPGDYTIIVGFYDANDPTFIRAAATAPNGARYPNDAIPLSTPLHIQTN